MGIPSVPLVSVIWSAYPGSLRFIPPPTTDSLYTSENVEGIYPAPVQTKMVVTTRIPQDIINEISDLLAAASDFRSLRSCALLSRSWVQPCRRHLFRVVVFTSKEAARWLKTFPEPEESPAHHVRDLRVWIGGADCVPDKLFEYIQWFTDLPRIYFLGDGRELSLPRPSLWKLPQSITSLTINTNVFTLTQVWDIMVQLPNLDDLSLSGSRIQDILPETRTPLRGRFGGRLLLSGGYSSKGVMGKLLEIPSGLCFTEVEISCTRISLLPAVRLAEACSKALVKLSQTFYFFGESPLLPVQPVLVHKSIDGRAISRCRSPRDCRAGLRLLQISKPPRSDPHL